MALPAIETAPIPELTFEEVRVRVGDPSAVLLNVLPREAFRQSRIPGSRNLPLSELEDRARSVLPDRNQEIVAYCGGYT